MTHSRRVVGTLASAAAVAVIGWIDYITGPDIGFSLVYILPVAASGWFAGMLPAIVVAVAAAVSWFAADRAWRASDLDMAISLWNGFTRLVIYVSQGVMLAILHRDRDQLRRYAARQSMLARTDHTTSLPNARSFHEAVEREIELAREGGDCMCILYIDLDDFKSVNDRYGHEAGDAVLQRTAAVLMRSIRGHDLAARLGGDEFGVLLTGVDPQATKAIGDRIVRRIAALGEDYPEASLGATAGGVCCEAPPESASDLIRAADAVMYEGKKRGKGTVTMSRLSEIRTDSAVPP